MTPYEIDIALWYHTRAEDHPQVKRLRTPEGSGAGLVSDTFVMFVETGMLRCLSVSERNISGILYVATDKLNAYCSALQQVPLPTQKWVVDWPKSDTAETILGPMREFYKAFGM